MKKKVYRILKECISCGKNESYYHKTVKKNSETKPYTCVSCYEEMVKSGSRVDVKVKDRNEHLNLFGY